MSFLCISSVAKIAKTLTGSTGTETELAMTPVNPALKKD
jgi:hypothetical protein